MLELSNVLKKVSSDTHIEGINLKFERGELNVLLGPTLSGKTTLMRLMAGLDKPTRGQIKFDNVDVTGVPVRKRNVAMVYQQFINYPSFTVYENIASPIRIAGLPNAEIDKKVKEAASLLKLDNYLDRTPLQLSGGQQQRTAIARALVKGADLVLMDEPLANLDYKLREELRVELPRIFAGSGTVFVYATTEPHEALLLGGKTATLDKGRVTQFDKTIEVYNRPRNLLTAQTFSDPPLNTALAKKVDNNLRFGEHTLGGVNSDIADGEYTVGIRPHHISLSETSNSTSSIPAVVGTSEITGSETFLHVAVGDQSWVVLANGIHRLEKDSTVNLYLNPNSFYLFDSEHNLVSDGSSKMQAG